MLFVYGSLKEGFPNFHVNKGRRLPGSFKTVEKHPFWLYRGQLPCLLPASETGRQVVGQLFEVSAHELAAMDELERVAQPGGYSRHELRVARIDVATTEPLNAYAYMQDPALLLEPGSHIGPIDEYTLEHAKRLSW
jgi:gamma-glutamylaminecyclotransferase